MSTDEPFNRSQVETIGKLLEKHRRLWPLSFKQVYYLAVEAGAAGTSLDEGAACVWAVRQGMKEDLLPVDAFSWSIASREGGAWDDADEFLLSELDSFLWGYRRNLMQGQERYVEVWVQKPDVLDFIANVSVEYCVSAYGCEHLPTVKFMRDFGERLEEARRRSQSAVVLFFGDYVPGTSFLGQVQDTLRTDANLWEMELRHQALTCEQVIEHDLPESIEVRARKPQGKAEPGEATVELEALPPDLLERAVREAIEAQLDMALLHNQRAIQDREAMRLGKIRVQIMRSIRTLLRDLRPEKPG
jgi:hypothetical protein